MTTESLQIIAVLAGAFSSAGAAHVGVKVALNGTRERVKEIAADVRSQGDTLASVDKRLAVMEVIVDRRAHPR